MRSSSFPAEAHARKGAIRERALQLGFDAVGFCLPEAAAEAGARLKDFIAQGRHGDMIWLEEKSGRRAQPNALWPEARSVIVCAMNYGPDGEPLEILQERAKGAISVYARARDYHDVLKGKLKILAGEIAQGAGAEVKVFVDTAPVMEKPLAQAARLGWQGKHTNLVSREFGSWLFLGSIFTTLELPADEAESDHCGQCRACLDICPTNAFPAPYQLDARRCISYLTIEHKGHIGREFRAAIGNRIYGCDDCLAVCPWNKFATRASETKFQAREALRAPELAALAALDDAGFRALFSGSAVKRLGRECFVRNVLIAIGNSGETKLAACAEALTDDASTLVRAMAAWALKRLLAPQEFKRRAAKQLVKESDDGVRAEWA